LVSAAHERLGEERRVAAPKGARLIGTGVPGVDLREEPRATVGVGRIPRWVGAMVGVFERAHRRLALPCRVAQRRGFHIHHTHQLVPDPYPEDVTTGHGGSVRIALGEFGHARLSAPARARCLIRAPFAMVVPRAPADILRRRRRQDVHPAQPASLATVHVGLIPISGVGVDIQLGL